MVRKRMMKIIIYRKALYHAVDSMEDALEKDRDNERSDH